MRQKRRIPKLSNNYANCEADVSKNFICNNKSSAYFVYFAICNTMKGVHRMLGHCRNTMLYFRDLSVRLRTERKNTLPARDSISIYMLLKLINIFME